MTTQPFGMVELAVKELIGTLMPDAVGKVGGDMSYTADQDFYVWIGLVPGSGRTDQLEGSWAVDIDVFDTSYAEAMGRALSLEALLVGPRHITSTMRVDNVYQNAAPSELPWDDDSVFRISATYVFTARRP